MKESSLYVVLSVTVICLLLTVPLSAADEHKNSAVQGSEQDNVSVLQPFVTQETNESDIVSIDDRTKRIVMFAMGVPLLILLITTAALGVAMGVYGKPVFLLHMICAGLSVTLAIAHAVVGIVWFYPF